MSRPEVPAFPGLPRDAAGEPVFAEPWQAKAFAMTVALNARGAFGWPEWAAALAAELAREGGDDYWRSWLRALERVLADRAVADAGTIDALAETWIRAAAATPHGTPIRLRNAAPDP